MYNGLQVSADRRYRNGLKVGVAYTFSKSSDNGSSRRDYIYDLPLWRNQDTLLHNLLGGWQISGATFYRTGTPFTAGTVSQDFAGVGLDRSAVQRGRRHPRGRERQPVQRQRQQLPLQPEGLRAPGQVTWGNETRDAVYGPGANEWDLALLKNFKTTGTSLVQVRAEVFNLFNHPNLNTTSRESAMAIPTAATFGRITGKDDARRDIRLSLRFQF